MTHVTFLSFAPFSPETDSFKSLVCYMWENMTAHTQETKSNLSLTFSALLSKLPIFLLSVLPLMNLSSASVGVSLSDST